jgi:N-acyl amino acid synthase FeeM
MSVNEINGTSRFAERIARLLEKVEFRRAVRPADREAVYRLRYEAYRRQNLLNPRLVGRLYDEVYDESLNGCSTMTFIDGELASTIRVHVGAHEDAILPSLRVFPDAIIPHLRRGRAVVDPTRLAARLELSRRYPELPYFALRPAWMAAQYFNADCLIATTSVEHEGFYRRVCGYQRLTEPREYPQLTFKVVCMGLDFPSGRRQVEDRYPSFTATEAECEALFGGQLPLRRDCARSSAGRPSDVDQAHTAMAIA